MARGRIAKSLQFVIALQMLLALLLISPLGISGEEKKGTITIKNETHMTLYIVIDDYNKGEVWSNYSETYKVTIGQHKVQAYYGDKVTSKYITLSETYPDETWYITESSL